MEWVGVCSSDLGGGEGGSVGAAQWREMGTLCWEGEQSFLPPQHFLTASPDSLIETSSRLWFLFSTSEAEPKPLVWSLNKLELKSPQRGNWERLLSVPMPLCTERGGRSDTFSWWTWNAGAQIQGVPGWRCLAVALGH